jgi:branched-subunit amino acid aminotransferase/4-amino-4-deoxychorismate lyase
MTLPHPKCSDLFSLVVL